LKRIRKVKIADLPGCKRAGSLDWLLKARNAYVYPRVCQLNFYQGASINKPFDQIGVFNASADGCQTGGGVYGDAMAAKPLKRATHWGYSPHIGGACGFCIHKPRVIIQAF
jgi:hypothetical protein